MTPRHHRPASSWQMCLPREGFRRLSVQPPMHCCGQRKTCSNSRKTRRTVNQSSSRHVLVEISDQSNKFCISHATCRPYLKYLHPQIDPKCSKKGITERLLPTDVIPQPLKNSPMCSWSCQVLGEPEVAEPNLAAACHWKASTKASHGLLDVYELCFSMDI